jgi:hypothetical protein
VLLVLSEKELQVLVEERARPRHPTTPMQHSHGKQGQMDEQSQTFLDNVMLYCLNCRMSGSPVTVEGWCEPVELHAMGFDSGMMARQFGLASQDLLYLLHHNGQ